MAPDPAESEHTFPVAVLGMSGVDGFVVHGLKVDDDRITRLSPFVLSGLSANYEFLLTARI